YVPCKSKAASVPAGSRNSSASVTAGGSDPAASRNRPAVNSAGRPNPTGRVGQAAHRAAAQSNPAGWSKSPAPVSAGRPVSAGWFNPAARPYFRPSSVYFNNMYWPELYDPMYMNEGRWGTGDPSTDNDIGIVDSGCSRSMTGNKEKLDDFVQVKGGIVKFGGGDGRISGKGTIRTSKLDFENVYYVEELQHFNLFSVSQICDKKNKVLFTDTDCLVLTEEFQLPDESQVVLRIPRERDLYTFSISELQPEQNVTCLVAKASLDESTRWHRRMAHVNFKTINKLAKEGLVDGLPLKVFTNEHNCVACNKGKQHKASYKHISAGKSDKGYLVGYAPNSKAYRVYNLPNKRIEETLNLRFLEDKPNVQGIGHEWYFDLDYLTDSLGYTRFKTNKPADNVKSLAKASRQENEAKDSACTIWLFFSTRTTEILSQAEAEIRNQGVSADRDHCWKLILWCNHAGSFNPAGSYEPAGTGNPAVSTSVSADFIHVHADESILPPGQSLGSSENTNNDFPVLLMDNRQEEGINYDENLHQWAQNRGNRLFGFRFLYGLSGISEDFKMPYSMEKLNEEVVCHFSLKALKILYYSQSSVQSVKAFQEDFKYLKGNQIRLWYPKEFSISVGSHSDSDYAWFSCDRNPLQVDCQYLAEGRIWCIEGYYFPCDADGLVLGVYNYTSAGGFISADRVCVPAVCMVSAVVAIFLICWRIHSCCLEFVYCWQNQYIYTANCFVLFDIAGWLVSATSHLVSAGSLHSCWCNNVSAA
ncbi:putative ribonuclease H-like domain-containing protein, partial [Tanacetum coccineum]